MDTAIIVLLMNRNGAKMEVLVQDRNGHWVQSTIIPRTTVVLVERKENVSIANDKVH